MMDAQQCEVLNATEHFKMWILCYMYFTIFKATILNLKQVPSFRLYEHLRGHPNDIPACLQQCHLHPSQSGRKVDHIPDQPRAQKAEAQDSWQQSGCLLMESAARPLCSCTSPSLPEPLLPPAARGLSPHSMQLASGCSAWCPAQSDGSVNHPNSDSTGRCQKALSKCPPFKALALNNLLCQSMWDCKISGAPVA